MKLKKIAGSLLASLLLSSTDSAKEYAVVQGDSLFKISRQFRVNIEEIRKENRLTSDMLRIGQKLTIPGEDPENNQPVKKQTVSRLTTNKVSPKRAVVNVNNLNVRQEGNLNTKILTTLKMGINVNILEKSGDWTKVKVGGINRIRLLTLSEFKRYRFPDLLIQFPTG